METTEIALLIAAVVVVLILVWYFMVYDKKCSKDSDCGTSGSRTCGTKGRCVTVTKSS